MSNSASLTERSQLRAALLAQLDRASPAGGLSEEDFVRLGELVESLRPLSLYAMPATTPEKLAGRWGTLFAHFGVRHSAGKPQVHDSNLKIQSFNSFPPLPIRVQAICQEVSANGAAYNNVVSFQSPDGAVAGDLIVRGRWQIDADISERLHVEFWRTELQPATGVSVANLRAALGAPDDMPVAVDLKPPRLHSDVVYMDDDLRINIGGLGGLYVLRRLAEPTRSF